MRDIALVLIVLAILPHAIRHTWIAVMLWTWISVMNPHTWAYGFAFSAPFAAVAAGAALISLFVTRDKLSLPPYGPVVVLILFVLWMCITTAFAIYPELSWVDLNRTLKIQLMTVVAFAAVRERKHINWFVGVNALSIGIYGVKGGLFAIATGGGARVWGPPGGFIEGNNEIGLALILVIPLLNYMRMHSPNKWARRGLVAVMALSAVAALATQSRGAFLALTAMGLVLWLRSPKKLVSAVAIGATAMVLLAFMPSVWEERMSTIKSYEQDSSAMGRINAWTMTVRLANDRLLGGGFEIYTPEMFARYAPNPEDIHVAHSIYFSALGEHGYPGLFLFLLLGTLSFLTASRIRKLSKGLRENRWLFDLAGMCQVSLVGYAVGGAFLSLTYFDLPYNIVVVLVASLRLLKESRHISARASVPHSTPDSLDKEGGAHSVTALSQ